MTLLIIGSLCWAAALLMVGSAVRNDRHKARAGRTAHQAFLRRYSGDIPGGTT